MAMTDNEYRPGWVRGPDGNWQQIDPGVLEAANKAKADEVAAAAKATQNSKGLGVTLLACGALFVAAIIYGAVSGGSDSQTTASNDSSLACDHFRNVAGDVSAGILTDAELRSKLQEVNSNAAIATPAVQAAATKMLRAATTGTIGELADAVEQMGSACRATGN